MKKNVHVRDGNSAIACMIAGILQESGRAVFSVRRDAQHMDKDAIMQGVIIFLVGDMACPVNLPFPARRVHGAGA